MIISPFRRIAPFLLSASVFLYTFCSHPLPVSATAEQFAAEAEARKSQPVETNQISNWPPGPAIGAQGAILMDANTGTILYSKNIHDKLYPASITKILTCLLAVENAELNDTVTFSHEAVYTVPWDGSNMGMDEGEAINLEECLYGILVYSANEVANAVAEHVAGSLDAFAEMMNKRAKELGCTDSNFVNANGLYDENHYTSAHDMALIAQAFFNNELLCKISGTTTYHFTPTDTQPDDFVLHTKNKLVTGRYEYDGIVGGKTGYTKEARETLVTCAKRGDMKLVCVILKEESPYQFKDTMALFDYGFDNFQTINISENETGYRAAGYGPILSIDPDSYIILPKDASFSSAESSIVYDEAGAVQTTAAAQTAVNQTDTADGAGAGSVSARIEYSYQGISVGSAPIRLAAAPAAAYDFESPAVTPVSGGGEGGQEAGQAGKTGAGVLSAVLKWLVRIVTGIAGALCVFLLVCVIIRNVRLEMRRRARKRRWQERRRRERELAARDYYSSGMDE